MTVREIADAAGVSPRTVQRVAGRVLPGRVQPGRQSEFSREEAVRIMSEVRKRNFVEPRQNDAEARQSVAVRLNAAALHEIRMMVKERILSSSQARALLGVGADSNPPKRIEAPADVRLKAEEFLGSLRRQFEGRLERDRLQQNLEFEEGERG